ncbi:MAG: proteasome-activating nucleotidase [Euryarchaeota archaeon]|nr:proteasome-activating nucleotidase [Euryarchaeota archaeon]
MADIAEVSQDRGEFSEYLLNRLRQLETLISQMKDENRRLETEKRYIESERIRLERELRKFRSELERLKSLPLVVATVIDSLNDDRIIVKSSTGPNFVVTVSQFIDRKDLVPGARVALNQQSFAIVGVLPTEKDPMVLGMEIDERPKITYEDIGGLEEQINEIRETIELPLKRPDLFEKVGIEPPKGVLLYGPPGTGKTLLGKGVAHETEATFIKIIGSELVQKYIGEGARLVREVFQLAREKAPSIIFIDELDAIAAKRLETATSGDREVQRTLMQLLAEMDGFDPRGEVKIIGATNRSDILDPAILRPGRFDRFIEVPLPNFRGRVEIFKIHTKKINLSEDFSIEKLASITDGASGADIKAICTEAGMFAIREEREKVTMADFDQAVIKVLGSTKFGERKREAAGVMFG